LAWPVKSVPLSQISVGVFLERRTYLPTAKASQFKGKNRKMSSSGRKTRPAPKWQPDLINLDSDDEEDSKIKFAPSQSNPNYRPAADMDEESDENWEEVEKTPFGEYLITQKKGGEEPMEIDIPLDNGVRAKKRKGISRAERTDRLQLHVAHFTALLAAARWRNDWCDDKAVQATILSLLPEELIRLASQIPYKDQPDAGTDTFSVTTILRAVTWWKGWLDSTRIDPSRSSLKYKTPTTAEGLIPLAINTLAHVPKEEKNDLRVLLTVAMLRALGIHTRLVVSLHPISTSMTLQKQETGQKRKAATSDDEAQRKKAKQMDTFLDSLSDHGEPVINLDTDCDDEPVKRVKTCPGILYFAEILLPSHEWTPLNLEKLKWMEAGDGNPIIDCATRLGLKQRYGPQGEVIWVVALQFNSIRDVTSRYAPRQTSLIQKASTGLHRPFGWFSWWPRMLDRYAKVPRKHKLVLSSSWAKEDAQFRRVAVDTSSKLPTRLEDFRNHPLYVLEKHLRRNEILHPKDKILATYRKEPVYARECVKHVHSKEHWQKLGRLIKEDEQPAKLVKRRQPHTIKGKRAREQMEAERGQSGSEEVADAQGQVPLYGEWQTNLYVAPPVVNGIVPKSQYGTVELFVPSMLPCGAAHVRMNGAAKVAKELGLDFAKAVVGFEWKRGACIPVVDGIVVAKESEVFLKEATLEKTASDDVKAATRSRKRAIANWRRLARKALVHSRIKARYSEQFDDVGGGGFLPDSMNLC